MLIECRLKNYQFLRNFQRMFFEISGKFRGLFKPCSRIYQELYLCRGTLKLRYTKLNLLIFPQAKLSFTASYNIKVDDHG